MRHYALEGTTSRGMRRRLTGSAALAALACLVIAGSAATGTATKPYTPTFSPVPPATVAGGSTQTIHLTVVNNAGQQSIQSANVTAPSGLTITGVSPALNPYSAFDSAQIRLRQIAIGPTGGTYNLDITVAVPCAAGDYLWAIKAKQSNDFNGPPGNDFTPVNASLTTKVASAPLDHFTVATVGNQVAGSGFKVTATAYDSCGSKKTDYAGGAMLSGNLSSTGSYSPTYGTFASGSFVNANGSAQSSDTIAVKAPETLRTLTATAIGQAGTSPASNQFNVAAGAPASATFTQQPSNVQVSTAMAPPPVTVKAVDAYGNDSGGYTLTLSITPGTGASGATLTGGGSTLTDASGVATFGSLSVDKVGGPAVGTPKYTLDTKYGTSTLATSTGFSVDLLLVPCDPSQTNCDLPQQNLPSPKNTTTTFDATASGGGATGLAFNLGGVVPPSVTGAGGGCAYFDKATTGAPGITLDVRPYVQGVLEMDYGIPTKLIQASPNNGNKFVPICAHARRIGIDGIPVNCDAPNAAGGPAFKSKTLTSSGVLTSTIVNAVCDPGTHEWWGILPTYQDAVDPTTNPIISAWGGGTAPDGTNLRIFTIRVPAPWDWGHSG